MEVYSTEFNMRVAEALLIDAEFVLSGKGPVDPDIFRAYYEGKLAALRQVLGERPEVKTHHKSKPNSSVYDNDI